MQNISLEPSWKSTLREILVSPKFKTLIAFVNHAYENKEIYPDIKDIFNAFSLTAFHDVAVVILGQDPYHGPGQAHGLCFSVSDGVTPPPSLKNIYKEIESDIGIQKDFTNGNLESWATQGVFLLNAILSVEKSKPASHKGKGWEDFTDYVIQKVSDEHEHVVFMLWGNYAKSKKVLIDTKKHLVLESPHPSPFSAHSGFFGCKHFSKCNEYLEKNGKKEIFW